MTDQEPGNAPNPPAAPPQPNWVVRRVQEIKRYFHDRHTAKKQENPQDRASRRTANATVWIAALTLAVVFIGGLQYLIFKAQLRVMADQLIEMKGTGVQTDTLIETNKKLAEAASVQAQAAKDSALTAHENLIASQRAWISPTSFSIVDVTDARHPLQVRMTYQNVGREPARNIRTNMTYGYIRNPTPPEPSSWATNPAWRTIDGIIPKKMCESVSSSVNSVAYPTPNTAFTLEINDRDDPRITAADVQVLFDEVKSQKSMYYVAGCLSYETLKERKNSTFCALLIPVVGKDITQWRFGACPVGNEDF